MPSVRSSTILQFLCIVTLWTMTGCGTLLSRRRPKRTEPVIVGDRRDSKTDEDRFPHRNADDRHVDDRTARDFDRGRRHPAEAAVTGHQTRDEELNSLIDHEYPNIDQAGRKKLLELVENSPLDKAKLLLRYGGGQYRERNGHRAPHDSQRTPSGDRVAGPSRGPHRRFQNSEPATHAGYSRAAKDGHTRRDFHPDTQYDQEWNRSPGHSHAFRNPRRGNSSSNGTGARDNDNAGRSGDQPENRRPGLTDRILNSVGFTGRSGNRNTGTPGELRNGVRTAAASDEPWNDLLQKLIISSETKVSQKPAGGAGQLTPQAQLQHIRDHVNLRLMYLISGQSQLAVEQIPGLEPNEEKFWRELLWGIASYFDTKKYTDRSERALLVAKHLRTAVHRLSDIADLEIPMLVFCTKITSFGVYDAVKKPVFRAGERALIYAEVENFSSKLNVSDGRYQTLLKSTISIYKDGGGKATEDIEFKATKDLCLRRRRDYFHSYVIDLPRKLAPGNYLLKLMVTDLVGDKVTIETMRFKID